jgi:hypothetical protein
MAGRGVESTLAVDLLHRLGRTMARAACAEASRWDGAEGTSDVRVSNAYAGCSKLRRFRHQ